MKIGIVIKVLLVFQLSCFPKSLQWL